MSGVRPQEPPPEPPETPISLSSSDSRLRYFKNRNKNKNAQEIHNSDSSNNSINDIKLPDAQNSQGHDIVGVPVFDKSYSPNKRKNDEDENRSTNESITSSISEHIIKQDSEVASVTNNDASHPDLSIPSLHLKSLSRSDSEYAALQQSMEDKSKLSSSPREYISDENISEKSPKPAPILIKNKQFVDKDISHNDNNERISNESSIHTLFDLSSSKISDKSRDSNIDYQDSEESGLKQIDIPKSGLSTVESEDPSLESNIDENENNKDIQDSKDSSTSEDIIKVDIRGTATRGFPLPHKMVFISNLDSAPPMFNNDFIALNEKLVNLATIGSLPHTIHKPLAVQCDTEKDNLKSTNENDVQPQSDSEQNSPDKQKSEEFEQDYEIEEMVLNKSRNIFPSKDNEDNVFVTNNGSKPNGDGDTSLSTIATEYKTLGEDFQHKIPEFEEALLQRDVLVDKLQVSLTNSLIQKEKLQSENEYLSSEVGKLQQLLSDVTSSNVESKGHLSDFVKHENLISEDNSEIFPINTTISKILTDNFSQTENNNVHLCNEYLDADKTIETSDYTKPAIFLSGIESFQNDLDNEELPLFLKFKNKLSKLIDTELHNKYEMFLADLKCLNEKFSVKENIYKSEQKRCRDLLISIKSNNPELIGLRNEMEIKHQKEMEELRTYFEQKCADMEKHYSEEVFSSQSKKMSVNSSNDSLNNCPEALPFGSPFHRVCNKMSNVLPKKLKRSRSFEFPKLNIENLMNDLKNDHKNEIQNLTRNHENYVKELITSHESYLSEIEAKYRQQIADLKADLQTYQNTEIDINIAHYDHRDADLELEKESLNCIKDTGTEDGIQQQALLSDPNSDLSSWPLNLIALKDKIEADTQQAIEQLKMKHAEELTALREENDKQALEVQKYAVKEEEWRTKRHEAFDKNRHLEDVVKERDGLKRMIVTLQKVLSQLVEYFNLCEDELNNTVVGELLKQVMLADENFDNTIILNCTIKSGTGSQNQSFDNSFNENEHNLSAISNISKKISFVPNVNEIMTYIDTDCIFDGSDLSQDISVNFKHDLDSCLKKLRTEAQELLALSSRRIPKRLSILENDELEKFDKNINENSALKNDFEQISKYQELYEKSEVARKELEEYLAQSRYQEVILREELQMALEKIAEFSNEPIPSNKEVISEGYGIVMHPKLPVSLPPHPRVAITSPPPFLASEGNTPEGGRSLSLDGILDKRISSGHEVIRRLTCELEAVNKEKEDIQMQLEAANKQLKSTRQFLEEQAAEREQERDEYQAQLEQLKEENSKLMTKTQQHTRVCKEVEQLEIQIRELNGLLSDIENKKSEVESDLKSTVEKSLLLRDIIGNLETQLEKKTVDEADVLKDLENLKQITEEKEIKIQNMAEELERLRDDIGNRIANDILSTGKTNSDSIATELEIEKKVVEQMRGQLEILADILTEHTTALENLHEAVCSHSCSSPSEDVSIRNHKKHIIDESSFAISMSPSKLLLQLPLLEITRLGDTVNKHLKAEDAALKRIRDLEMQLIQLKDVAQELRTERDILQDRMSEQSLRISSLQSRLDQTRHTAEQIRHQSTEELRLQLDEAHSKIQLLHESLDSRDKQVARLKSLIDKKKVETQEIDLSSSEKSNKHTVQILRKEVSELQIKNRELEEANELNKSMPEFFESIVADKDADIDALKHQLRAVLKLNLEEEELSKRLSQSEKDGENQGRHSARTLSDIMSISEFDEPEILRKAELKPYSCISDNLQMSSNITKNLNITSLPEMDKIVPIATACDLHITLGDNYNYDTSPVFDKDDSSKRIKDNDQCENNLLDNYKRNINETTVFGLTLKSEKNKTDDCELTENSMFPNKNASDNRNVSMEPKKIDFSAINLSDENHIRQYLHNELINLSNKDIEKMFDNFKESGIEFKLQSNNHINVLVQIQEHVHSLKEELKLKELSLKNLEKQFNEILDVQNEVDELREGLQNNLIKMDEDKLYYNNQLEKLVSGEVKLKEQLQQAINDSNEKVNELQVLKEDILRRENLLIELTKEKRNLQKALSDLEYKYNAIKSTRTKNADNDVDDMNKLQGLETLILEKNQQIDNLNVNLDKFDDIERDLNKKKSEIEKLNDIIKEKSTEFDDLSKAHNKLINNEQILILENSKLTNQLKEYVEDNSTLKSANLKMKNDMKSLENKLIDVPPQGSYMFIDKDTCESVNEKNKDILEGYIKLEDFETFFNELKNLASPNNSEPISLNSDKWDFDKIKNYMLKLQVELNFKRKELNGKVFELERAKFDNIDLKHQSEELSNHLIQKDDLLKQLVIEKDEIQLNLKEVMNKLHEESNIEEIKLKLNKKLEECDMLEKEVKSLKIVIDRYHHDLNSYKEKENHFQEILIENGRLKQHLMTLENKIIKQESLISDLNEVKENLVADLQDLEEKSEVEKDTSARLKHLLDTEKQMANNIQNQDSNVIQILKDRLEVSLDSESELKMLLEREKKSSEQSFKQVDSLKKQLKHFQEKSDEATENIPETINVHLTEKLESVTAQLDAQVEITDLLKSEIMLLNSKRDRDKSRLVDLQNVLDREKLWFQKEIDSSKEQISSLKRELSELMRQKHEMHLELVNSREKLHLQKNEISALEKRIIILQESNKSLPKADSYRTILNDLEQQNKDLISEISSLKLKLELATERENVVHVSSGFDRHAVGKAFDDEPSTLHYLKEMQLLLKKHIAENVQITETVQELTQERRELQLKVRQLEGQNFNEGIHQTTSLLNLPEGVDQQIRFLNSRYMRMQSYRKALIWQKKYLTRVVSAFEELQLKFSNSNINTKSSGIKRWRCIVISIRSIFRMKYLVRRWHTGNILAANVRLNIPNVYPVDIRSSKSCTHIPSSFINKEKKIARSRNSLHNPATSHYTPSTKHTNKSWSMGSATNISAAERVLDQHMINPQSNCLSHQSPLRSNLTYMDSTRMYNDPERWRSINDQRWLRTSHQEFFEENYPLHSPTSENDASSGNSRYSHKLDPVQVTRHRTSDISKDIL